MVPISHGDKRNVLKLDEEYTSLKVNHTFHGGTI